MDLERDFAEWADRCDPAALTRVFDGSAGRLVLVAAHLVGPQGSAEDLVQATFLAAMAKAGTWDRERPLWPWLTAILQNEARMLWRKQRRRREVDLGAATAAPATAPDPQTVVASDEAFDALLGAIEALPLPYRQVLRLRLVHDMQPIEIARALEQPMGTVRAQLHRGLERLRSALPAGVAGAVAAWLSGEGALLAQVRARVIAEAAAHAAASAGGVLLGGAAGQVIHGGWWAMHGKTVGVSIVSAVLLLLAAYVGWFGSGHGEQTPAPTTAMSAPVGAGSGAGQMDAASAPAELERDDADSHVTAVWPLEVIVRAAAAPVAGATVRVRVVANGFGYGESAPSYAFAPIASGLTDADGRWRCDLDELRQCSVMFRRTNSLVIEVDGAVSLYDGDREMLALPRTVESHEFVAEFELEEGIGIIGRIVDRDGVAISGVDIHRLRGQRLSIGSAKSRDDGTFFLSSADEALPDAIAVRDSGHGFRAVPIESAAESKSAVVDVGVIKLTGERAISGRVILGDGAPLTNYPLYVAQMNPAHAEPLDSLAIRRSFYGRRELFRCPDGVPMQVRTQAMTDDDGRFVCAGLDPAAMYAVCVPNGLRGYTAITPASVGDTVRIEVDGQLTLLTVCSSDGESLHGADIRGDCYDPSIDRPSWNLRPGFPEKGQFGSGGVFPRDAFGRLQILSTFGHVWAFYATDEIAQSAVLRHDVFAGVHRTEQRLVLRSADQFGHLRLLVESPEGEPIERHGFRMKHLERDVSRNHVHLIPPDDRTYRELPVGRWQLSVLLGPPLTEVFGWSTSSRGLEEREVVIRAGETTEVRVVVEPAGRVAFRLSSKEPPASGAWDGVKLRGGPRNAELEHVLHADDQSVVPWPIDTMYYLAKSAFPPGTWGFEVVADGYQPVFCEVDVTDARLSTVIVDLVPR